jgi:hypothetical protein
MEASATILPGRTLRGFPKDAIMAAPWNGDTAAIRTAESKVENQIAGHGKLIVPSTLVVSLLIPGTLET